MRGASWAPALLLLAAAAAAAAAATATTTADEPLEDEVESAPFAIVVEHADGWRCGGALVSLRAALSTWSCARGRAAAPPADLWARAPGAPAGVGARRVARVAVAVDAQGYAEVEKWTEEAWIGSVQDIALLELEAAFGAEAGARPILMAAGDECAPGVGGGGGGAAPACHVVRTPPHAGAPLRVGNAERAAPMACMAAAPHWTAVADVVLCLAGPQFCQSDWGVGVVCAGKLCGVLSRSARSSGSAVGGGGDGGDSGGAGRTGEGCGDTHVAQHVPRWREFVRCAQTRYRCGSDICASVCSERMLLEASAEESRRDERGRGGGGGGGGGGSDIFRGQSHHRTTPDDYGSGETKKRVATSSTDRTGQAQTKRKTLEEIWQRAGGDAEPVPTRTPPGTPPPPPPPPPPARDKDSAPGRMAQFEFEPYRADFKIGEYGDNAASYDTGDWPTRTSSSTTPSREPEALVEQAPPAGGADAAPSAPKPNATQKLTHRKARRSGAERIRALATLYDYYFFAPFSCIFVFSTCIL